MSDGDVGASPARFPGPAAAADSVGDSAEVRHARGSLRRCAVVMAQGRKWCPTPTRSRGHSRPGVLADEREPAPASRAWASWCSTGARCGCRGPAAGRRQRAGRRRCGCCWRGGWGRTGFCGPIAECRPSRRCARRICNAPRLAAYGAWPPLAGASALPGSGHGRCAGGALDAGVSPAPVREVPLISPRPRGGGKGCVPAAPAWRGAPPALGGSLSARFRPPAGGNFLRQVNLPLCRPPPPRLASRVGSRVSAWAALCMPQNYARTRLHSYTRPCLRLSEHKTRQSRHERTSTVHERASCPRE